MAHEHERARACAMRANWRRQDTLEEPLRELSDEKAQYATEDLISLTNRCQRIPGAALHHRRRQHPTKEIRADDIQASQMKNNIAASRHQGTITSNRQNKSQASQLLPINNNNNLLSTIRKHERQRSLSTLLKRSLHRTPTRCTVLASLILLFSTAILHSSLSLTTSSSSSSNYIHFASAQSYGPATTAAAAAAVEAAQLAATAATSDTTNSQYHPAAAASQADSNPQPAASSTSSSSSAATTSAACFGGLQTFEKISMSSFENPAGSSSASSSAGSGSSSSSSSSSSFGSGILVQQDDQALTSECINLCRSQSNCLSFVIDYNKFECKSYATTQQELQLEFAAKYQAARAASTNSSGDIAELSESSRSAAGGGGYQASASSNNINFQQLLPSASSNYFEKICLDGVANRNQFSDVCGQGRLWTIERVVDTFLDGFVEKEVTNVNNKDECSKLCIFETQFVCRSADYDQSSRLCRLSKEDRRTQPQAMRYVANSQRQYLENQCATPGPSSCVYETKRNVGIISMDALKFAQTPQDCQMKCNQESTFNCRSYSFNQQRCFLSGDDSVSLNNNLIKLPQKQGWAFGEKKCLVELCTKGIFTYEKITGYTLRSALSSAIDLMMPAGSSSSSSSTIAARSAGSGAAGGETLQFESTRHQPSAYPTTTTTTTTANAYNGSSSSLASAMMMLMMSDSNSGHATARGGNQVVDPLHESASQRHTRSSSSSNLAITEHCRHSCDLGYLNCPAFTIDYKSNRCQRLDRNSQGRHHELLARDGYAYYEKICLRVPEIMSMCQDKYWIFERVLGYELAPRLYDKSLKFVQSRRDCEEYCLEEKQFQCRSALYNDETSDCKLSRLNRRLALQEGAYYRNFNARISYLENNCVRDHQLERKQCYYEQAKDEPAYPTFTELIEMVTPAAANAAPPSREVESSAQTSAERRQFQNSSSSFTAAAAAAASQQHRFGSSYCEQLCNDNSKFECHSFGYYASTAQCFLSGDDSVSAGDMATTPSTGFRYYEKKCRLGAAGSMTNTSSSSGAGGDDQEMNSPFGSSGGGGGGGGGGAGNSPAQNQNLNPYFQPALPRPPIDAPPTFTTPMSEPADNPYAAPVPSSANSTSSSSSSSSGAGYGSDQPGPASTTWRPPAASNQAAGFQPSEGGAGLHHRPHRLPAANDNDATNLTSSQADAYKCGHGHTFVYQRISGFEPIGGYLTLLAKNNEQPGIVAECAELCRRAYECRAFVVDYQSNQCFAMLENSSVGTLSLRQILGKDYFEGFCVADHLLLPSVSSASASASAGCRNKTWVMDKIVDQAVLGVQYAKLIADSDRIQCRQACLEERLFACKSAMYDSASGDCKLYSIDRESVPQMRLLFTKGVDFFENQCQITSNSCPYDAIERDMTIITATKSIQARSTFDCELACNSELGFNCRSYTYLDQYPSLPNLCLLSSDSRSTSQRGSVKEHQRTLYAERNCYYRRPRYPGGNSLSSSHKYDSAAYSPPLLGGASGGGGADATLPRPIPRVPINPLIIADPYAHTSPMQQPERPGSIQSGTSTGEQEGGTSGGGGGAGGASEFLAPGQGACEPHQYTFERTFGYDFKLAVKERAPIAPTIGIAIGCQQECLRRGDKCQSFVVDYALPYQSCFLLESQAGANKRALVRSPNSAYFEKVCLPRTGLVVDLPLLGANSQNELQLQSPSAPLTMLSQLEQQGSSSSGLVGTSATNPMVELLDPQLQSLDISPSYSQEPWSLQAQASTYSHGHAHVHSSQPQAPPPHASQLPYYLQQQHLVRNYPSRSCAKLWTFERFVNYNFTAPVDKVIEDSLTRAHCETHCLNEASFSCRAATYDYVNKVCRLFKNTRRTIMSQFVDLDSPQATLNGNGQQQAGSISSSGLANSYPGTAHVLDSSDSINAAASSVTGNELSATSAAVASHVATSRRHAGAARQMAIGTATTTTTTTVGQQQQHLSLVTAEPLFPGRNIDYLENTCTPEPSSCQYRQVYDQFSPFIDKVTHANSLNDCQRQCDQERLFSCKSLNYDPTSRSCMLVNEDLISLGRVAAAAAAASGSTSGSPPLMPKKNTIYSEKGNCEMISVQCNSQEMLVAINFDSPFRGRIMAKGNPEQCFALGDGQTSLQFPIVFGPKCNSRQEGHNTFVNEVVIQQHPVIMTESDKTVRVMCAFEAPEQTITLKNPSSRDNKTAGIDVGAPDSSRTRHDKQQFNSIVSSKAPPPSVMLRILDQSGRDASMINLGDDLMLKIQLQAAQQADGAKSSALGIFARNLAARSSNGESLLLIDNEGCPVDPQVFPALEIDAKDGKSLYSTFKAFRFPSSGLVNFEVQIKFCPERCQPVDCHKGGAHRARSYGRRRRKRQVNEGDMESARVQGRTAILQSGSGGGQTTLVSNRLALQQQQQQQQQPMATLDSLSTVMKPGKAFEYVRKLMLPAVQQDDAAAARENVREQTDTTLRDQAMSLPGGGSYSAAAAAAADQVETSQLQKPTDATAGSSTDNDDDRTASIDKSLSQVDDDQRATGANVSEQQANEDFDSHSLQTTTAAAAAVAAESSQFSPPDLSQSPAATMQSGNQFVPSMSIGLPASPTSSTEKLIPQQSDEQQQKSVSEPARPAQPAQPALVIANAPSMVMSDQFASTMTNAVNRQHFNLPPYGHFQTDLTLTRVAPNDNSLQNQVSNLNSLDDQQQQQQQQQQPAVTTDEQTNQQQTSAPVQPSGNHADESSEGSSSGDQYLNESDGFTSDRALDNEQSKMKQQSGQLPSGNKDMPLRFSILVGENQVPSADQSGAGAQAPPVLIMNSTRMDLDHIVIPGKKGLGFQEAESDLNSNSLSHSIHPHSPTTSTAAAAVEVAGVSSAQTTPTNQPGGYGDSSIYSDLDQAGVAGASRGSGRTRDTNKRNASYEQTFDAQPSSSVSSEIHIHDPHNHPQRIHQQQQHQQQQPSANHHQVRDHVIERSTNRQQQQQQHGSMGSESAASHDCQVESGRNRLHAIIWTGGIVISLNVCLVILSLVLYFRKVHSRRQNHSIVRSSLSDCGTSRSGRIRMGIGGGGGCGGASSGSLSASGGTGSQWPSVILKSKSKLGTSLNAHEHFFCKLNSKPGGSDAAALNGHEFNWPNLSTSSSHSTVSSLASALPSTSIRINQMRPSLKSVPFDAHSTLRSGNFNTGHGESDHEKNEYTARYTNNIDVLQSERF